jgi:hypothetical protein
VNRGESDAYMGRLLRCSYREAVARMVRGYYVRRPPESKSQRASIWHMNARTMSVEASRSEQC